MPLKILFLAAWTLATAFAQTPANFEESVRAAMAPSIAQQRASIQKQAAAARNTAGASSFFSTEIPTMATVLADCDPLPPAQLNPIVNEAAQKQGVSADLILAVIDQESAARPCAISFRGAQGIMQLMPATAGQFDVQDPFDPKQNIEAGAKLLKILLDKYDNDLSLVLGAYNAGSGRVDREGGIPPIPETLNYVSEILRKLNGSAPAKSQ